MGCASSGPLAKMVDGAKDTAGDVAHMGETAMHDLGDAAKGGMEHVKEAVESAVHTAEHGLGTMVDKIEETIGMKKEEASHATEDMKHAVDGLEASTKEAVTKAADGVTEEVSEAETVLASEVEEGKHVLNTVLAAAGDDVKVEDIEDTANEAMGSAVHVVDKPKEELVAKMPTPAHTPPPEHKAEPPTLWELEADAIFRPANPSSHELDLKPDAEPKKETEEKEDTQKEPEPAAEVNEQEGKETEKENEEEKGEENEEPNEEEEETKERSEDEESIDPDLLEREEQMRRLHLMMENEMRMQEMVG